MTQKILKVGTSAAVTMPKKALSAMGLSIGDHVTVDVEPKRRIITVKPAGEIRPEVALWTEGFTKKYKKALDELARR